MILLRKDLMARAIILVFVYVCMLIGVLYGYLHGYNLKNLATDKVIVTPTITPLPTGVFSIDINGNKIHDD